MNPFELLCLGATGLVLIVAAITHAAATFKRPSNREQ